MSCHIQNYTRPAYAQLTDKYTVGHTGYKRKFNLVTERQRHQNTGCLPN